MEGDDTTVKSQVWHNNCEAAGIANVSNQETKDIDVVLTSSHHRNSAIENSHNFSKDETENNCSRNLTDYKYCRDVEDRTDNTSFTESNCLKDVSCSDCECRKTETNHSGDTKEDSCCINIAKNCCSKSDLESKRCGKVTGSINFTDILDCKYTTGSAETNCCRPCVNRNAPDYNCHITATESALYEVLERNKRPQPTTNKDTEDNNRVTQLSNGGIPDTLVSNRNARSCSGSSSAGTLVSRPAREDCITRQYYTAFIVIMLLGAVVVVITCLCSATTDQDNILAPSQCPTGLFECETSHTCINHTLLCNDVFDCEDHSDEGSKCDKLHDKYYETILKKRPDAEFDRVDPNCDLHPIPAGCKCNNKTNVYCENDFQQVPPNLPDRVTFLDLSGNDIPVIGTNDLGYLPHLRKLLLVHSKIQQIEDGAFAMLPDLHEVQLTSNELTQVPGKAFDDNSRVKILNLWHNRISKLLLEDLLSFNELEVLYLKDNNISYIAEDAFSMMPRLKELDLSENHLEVIRSSFFRYLPNLQALYLNKNGISHIEPGSFSNLVGLGALSLRDNNLHHLPADIFTGLGNVTVLHLENNGIRTIDSRAFVPLVNVRSIVLTGNNLQNLTNRTFSPMKRLHFIYFDKFYQCVYAQHVTECEPRGDGISSRYNLLENLVLRVCVWLVAVLACVGNLLVFLGRFLLREDNQIHSFFIKNLSLADMLMGVYLLVIGSQDIKFRGEYLLHVEAWRNSAECDMCGVLSTLSTEMSVLTLCIITLDRYISIMYPLSFRKRGLKAAYGAMGCTWLVCLLLALLPITGISYFGTSFYRDNGVCVPLHIHDPRAQGWEYSSFLFLGINLASFAFIAYAYMAMFWSIHKSAIPLRSSRESKERCLVKRFFFIVITDFLCWIPIIIIKLIALAGVSISEDLYAWVIIFILPVNSALNPLLYTLTTKLFKQTLLSKFTSVVWRPSVGIKDASQSSRASVFRGNSSGIKRNVLQDVELELLRRHGCYKNGSIQTDRREKKEVHTISTPIASTPPSQFWNGNGSPQRQHCLDESKAMLSDDYMQT